MNLGAPTLELLSKKFFSASILHILAKSLSNILMLHKLSCSKNLREYKEVTESSKHWAATSWLTGYGKEY